MITALRTDVLPIVEIAMHIESIKFANTQPGLWWMWLGSLGLGADGLGGCVSMILMSWLVAKVACLGVLVRTWALGGFRDVSDVA